MESWTMTSEPKNLPLIGTPPMGLRANENGGHPGASHRRSTSSVAPASSAPLGSTATAAGGGEFGGSKAPFQSFRTPISPPHRQQQRHHQIERHQKSRKVFDGAVLPPAVALIPAASPAAEQAALQRRPHSSEESSTKSTTTTTIPSKKTPTTRTMMARGALGLSIAAHSREGSADAAFFAGLKQQVPARQEPYIPETPARILADDGRPASAVRISTSPFMAHKSTSTSSNSQPSAASSFMNRATPQALSSLAADFLSPDMLRFYAVCVSWYASSAITNNIGKQILNEYGYPVTLTYIQFGMVSVFSFATANSGIGFGRLHRPTLDVLRTILPLALFQVFSHIFSSIAMSYIPVSFAHTIKALSPLFTVMLYRIVYKIIYSIKVYISLIPLTLGVMLVCATELRFHTIGFLCALASSFVFVVQNVVSKKIFNNASSKGPSHLPKIDKINMLFYSSSMAFTFMLPIWAYSDGFTILTSHKSKDYMTVRLVLLFLLNGMAHFMQNVLAFWILSLVSPITYSIASLVKRIFVIVASIIYFRDSVGLVQAAGITLTFFGLWLYNEAKREVAKSEAQIHFIQERRVSNVSLPMHHHNHLHHLNTHHQQHNNAKITSKRSGDIKQSSPHISTLPFITSNQASLPR